MARFINRGSGDYIDFGGAAGVLNIANGGKISVSCLVKYFEALPTGTQVLLSKGYDGSTTAWQLYSDNGGNINWGAFGGGSGAVAAAHTMLDAAWHHVGGTYDQSVWNVYQDGASLGTNADATGTRSNTALFQVGSVDVIGTPGNKYLGSIAEVGVWDTDLTTAEMASLGKGFSPLLIRPSALIFYAPLIGKASPELDIVGGLAGTLTGTSTDSHPRVFMPRRVG